MAEYEYVRRKSDGLYFARSAGMLCALAINEDIRNMIALAVAG